MDNQQLLHFQRSLIKSQDHQLDQLGGIISNIKHENQNFSTEVKMQNKMLESLQVDMDDTHRDMVKIDSKLKDVVAKASTCKLWIIIIVEVAILLFILMLL
uniref:t-SNARE coiled-coil homology domain-containing protein n=1 Tax=Strombidium rassoulzadegani TaxID=1082188 RepID=A0A7S3CR94_9SPIT|mmetsp:Transcript_4361/g.7361  ORF Transcript_4361/g.7361 Transcript_4361/m.7361 type:complete len:101 (+) Transcript_4361:426-728(+)